LENSSKEKEKTGIEERLRCIRYIVASDMERLKIKKPAVNTLPAF
jgi:hypothetical protein